LGSVYKGRISVSPLIRTAGIHGNPNGCTAFQCINLETTLRNLQQIAMTPNIMISNTREINRSLPSRITITAVLGTFEKRFSLSNFRHF